MSAASILLPRLRVGEEENSGSRRLLLSTCFLLASISVVLASDEGQQRWRISDNGDELHLFIADTDFTDSVGSPQFRCHRGSSRVTIGGNATKALRNAMADLIRADEYPRVEFVPANPNGNSADPMDLSFSEASGWRYSFGLPINDPPFEQFKRTGALQFKVGTASVRVEFKVGLENIAKFQHICTLPPK